MDAVSVIALTMGVAWASGINLYATVFMLGLMGMTGHAILPEELAFLSDPMVLFAAGFMYCVEFFADKIPGVDSGWDTLHTFIRIPAGALLAASAVGDVSPAMELSAALLGGSLAAGSHFTKAGGRLLINTSPEPFSNWTASVSEDLLVIAGLWTALYYPWLFLAFLLLIIIMMIWLLPRMWRLIKAVIKRIAALFKRSKDDDSGDAGTVSSEKTETEQKQIADQPDRR